MVLVNNTFVIDFHSFFSGEKTYCGHQIGNTEFFIPSSKVFKKDSQAECKNHHGRVAKFSQVSINKTSNCLKSFFPLFLKQNDSGFDNTALLVYNYKEITLKTTNEKTKRRVLCTRTLKIETDNSEPSTKSSAISKTGLVLAIVLPVVFVGIPSLLLAIKPIRVSFKFFT